MSRSTFTLTTGRRTFFSEPSLWQRTGEHAEEIFRDSSETDLPWNYLMPWSILTIFEISWMTTYGHIRCKGWRRDNRQSGQYSVKRSSHTWWYFDPRIVKDCCYGRETRNTSFMKLISFDRPTRGNGVKPKWGGEIDEIEQRLMR